MIEHSLIPVGEIHGIINWEVASIGARDALSVNTADQGKVCHVVGDQCYILADAAGPTWETLSNTGALEASLTADIATAKSEAIATSEAYADTVSGTALTDAKDYADALATSALRDCGNFDASGGAYPSTGGTGVAGAIKKGNMWRISVAGTLPTAVSVSVGDWIRALVDAPGNTQANWSVSEANLGYIPLASLNGRTDAAAVASEYILENFHKLVVVAATDCVEATGRSQLSSSTTNGAVTYPSTATGMADATGIWRFTGTGASAGQFIVQGSSYLKLSAEPLVAVARFTWGGILHKPYVCLSLQAGSMFADTFYGVASTAGCHIVLHAQDNQVYFVTKSAGVYTGTVDTAALPAPDTAITFCIVATSSSVKYYMDGVLKFTHTTNIPTVDLVASFGSLDHSAASFFGHVTNLDLLQFFRLYKTTPRNLGIPSITY